MDSIGANNHLFSSSLVAPQQGPKLLITESDLEDYPGMFLTGNNYNATWRVSLLLILRRKNDRRRITSNIWSPEGQTILPEQKDQEFSLAGIADRDRR